MQRQYGQITLIEADGKRADIGGAAGMLDAIGTEQPVSVGVGVGGGGSAGEEGGSAGAKVDPLHLNATYNNEIHTTFYHHGDFEIKFKIFQDSDIVERESIIRLLDEK